MRRIDSSERFPARRLKRFLRSPALITAEIASIALAGVIGATFPQAHASGGADLARLREAAPALAAWGEALGLDRVFGGAGFLAAVALTAASLCVVVVEQARRLRRGGARRGSRIGPAGSLVVHVGLLLVIGAAALKALLGAEATVDLIEGETLPTTAAGWAVQRPGALAEPIEVAQSVTLRAVEAQRHEAGDLRSLSVRLTVGSEGGGSPREAVVPINGSVKASGVRLFVGSDYGPAALLEWQAATGGAPARSAALLNSVNGQRFEGALLGPSGEEAHLRAEVDRAGHRPTRIEVRVMKEGALLSAGDVAAGQSLALPDGGTLTLRGAPFWVRLHASRDPALWLIYLGFASVIAGVAIAFAAAPARAVCAPRSCLAVAPALVLMAIVASSCTRSDADRAKRLVERYNQVVAEAYRRGDVKLVDGVVGIVEGRRLTGLIGVRLDLGVTLDSQLLSLEVTASDRSRGEWRVRTNERWRYRDVRIGTGEQVGEEARDAYAMEYVFKRSGGTWVMEEIRFTSPPQVGRTQPLWLSERPAPHTPAQETPDWKDGSQP
jgi:cytochrome c biogenesis protein ResB